MFNNMAGCDDIERIVGKPGRGQIAVSHVEVARSGRCDSFPVELNSDNLPSQKPQDVECFTVPATDIQEAVLMLRRNAEVPDHQVQVFSQARVKRGKSGSQVLSRPRQLTCRVAKASGSAFPRKKAYGSFYEGLVIVNSVRVIGPVRLANISPCRPRIQPQRSAIRFVALPEGPQAGRTE